MRFRPSFRVPVAAKAVGLCLLVGGPLAFASDLLACAGCASWPFAAAPKATVELVGGRCTHLDGGPGRDTVVNSCNVCVTVRLEHRRPVGDVPSNRDYRLPAKSELPLSFRGGKTRILSEELCDGNPIDQAASPNQCLSLYRSESAVTVAVNTCGTCRLATIERISGSGRSSSEAVTVGARGYVPVNPQGAQYARLIGDQPCR